MMKFKVVGIIGILGFLGLGWMGLGFCEGVTVSGTTTVFTSIQAGVDVCPVGGR
ncbi:MAG: hypothetical protein V1749_02920 [Candidatus Desantisbacteria bacterium]